MGPLIEVDERRHKENEAIRRATERFIRWRALSVVDLNQGRIRSTIARMDELVDAWIDATGLEPKEYT